MVDYRARSPDSPARRDRQSPPTAILWKEPEHHATAKAMAYGARRKQLNRRPRRRPRRRLLSDPCAVHHHPKAASCFVRGSKFNTLWLNQRLPVSTRTSFYLVQPIHVGRGGLCLARADFDEPKPANPSATACSAQHDYDTTLSPAGGDRRSILRARPHRARQVGQDTRAAVKAGVMRRGRTLMVRAFHQ